MGGESEGRAARGRSAFHAVETGAVDSEKIHRFIIGIDPKSRVMTDAEAAKELNDPFAVLLLRKGKFPDTAEAVLKGIDDATSDDDALRVQMSFVVGEGSQILFSKKTASLARGLRVAITRGRPDKIDVLVSTDFEGNFLQVMGWDRKSRFFHYYERKNGVWVWAGNSTHALDPRSRGKGPFDSHVNGSMVMKELKFPWNHWHSVAATVPREVFPAGDPAIKNPFFDKKSGAEVFEERVVMPGVRRWTDSRFALTVPRDGTVEQVKALMEQLFVTTTVNLISSQRESGEVGPKDGVDLPSTFFADVDALSDTLDLPAPPVFEVSGKMYLDALKKFDVKLVAGKFRQEGDTHFAFLVPERAFEDLDVVRKCLETNLVSERFVGCALMVDFPNPIFSKRRASLLRHVPTTFAREDGSDALADRITSAIKNAATGTAEDSPEREFLALWELGKGWKAEAKKRLNAYFKAVEKRLSKAEGWEDYFRLAESRRRQVRKLELSEGRPLLFAHTNIPANSPLLEMTPTGETRKGGG